MNDKRTNLFQAVIASPQWQELAKKIAEQSEPQVTIICDLDDEYGRAMVTWDHGSKTGPGPDDKIWFFAIPQREYIERRGVHEKFFGKYSFVVVSGLTPLVINMPSLLPSFGKTPNQGDNYRRRKSPLSNN